MAEAENSILGNRELYLLESDILGYLPGFESGTTRALVSGVEAAAIALKVTSGLHNFRVDSPSYYLKWAGAEEREFARRYHEQMARQRVEDARLAEAA